MTKNNLSWELLCELEPRLLVLLAEVKSIKDDKSKPYFCANSVWYGHGNNVSIKNKMCELVGFNARGGDQRLHTCEAYDIALQKLYYALPDCRDCNCLG